MALPADHISRDESDDQPRLFIYPIRGPRRASGFKPFRCDPLLLGALHKAGLPGWSMWILSATVVAVLVVVNDVQDTLSFGPGAAVVWHDVITLVTGRDARMSPPEFPLARDVVNLLIIGAVAANFRILFGQWKSMTRFMRNLAGSSALHIASGRAEAVEQSLARQNAGYYWCGRLSTPIAFASFLLAYWILHAQSSGAQFNALAPAGLGAAERSQWLADAYSSWWASAGHPLGFLVYLVLATVAIYFTVLQNFVGITFVSFFVRHRNDFEYSADFFNVDGSYGWQELSRLMTTVFASLTVNTVALVALSAVVGGGNVHSVGTMLVVMVVLGPFYLLTPFLILRRRVAQVRERKAEELREAAARSCGAAERMAARREIEAIRQVTAFPIPRRLKVLTCVYVVPVSAGIAQIATWVGDVA